MKRSLLALKTRHEAPADEQAKNAQLLIRGGYIYKEMAGVYDYLPLGLMVIENIKQIVREEMNATGASEMLMSSLQRKEVWEKTDRWSDDNVDVWFKSKLASGTDVGFGWSHEEPITDMVRGMVESYRDLPVLVYQFQNKLRNELRAKSGIMRGREFLMKDLYSYTLDEEAHQKYYDQVTEAYLRVFDRIGIGEETFLTFASGGAFTQFSHEFQTITDAGEDIIYVDYDKKIAINKEVLTDEVITQLDLKREDLKEVKAAEVGNIFSFGTTKSEQLDLKYVDKEGQTKFVVLGSYGIGISRLMGVVAELMSDEKGLVWPASIAPAHVYLVSIGETGDKKALEIYDRLIENGVKVLWDDRDVRPGEKFADCDLLGIPWRVVVSEKTLVADQIEVKFRTSDDSELIADNSLLKHIA